MEQEDSGSCSFLCVARPCSLPPICPAGNGLRSGRKVLRQALAGKKLLEWYPSDPIKADPLMLDLKAEKCVALGLAVGRAGIVCFLLACARGRKRVGRGGWASTAILTCFCPTHATPAPLCPPSAKLKLDRLRRRGKAPPKKGAGKRAGKRK